MSRQRIRSIKPEMPHDEAVGECSREARLLFVNLMLQADDAGRLRLAPAAVIGNAYPYDADVTPPKLRKWLDELHDAGLILIYEHDGREYAWLRGWRANQKINRPTASKLPCPPDPAASWWPHDGNAPDLTESSVNGSGGDH